MKWKRPSIDSTHNSIECGFFFSSSTLIIHECVCACKCISILFWINVCLWVCVIMFGHAKDSLFAWHECVCVCPFSVSFNHGIYCKEIYKESSFCLVSRLILLLSFFRLIILLLLLLLLQFVNVVFGDFWPSCRPMVFLHSQIPHFKRFWLKIQF